jgi:hypothetical protein
VGTTVTTDDVEVFEELCTDEEAVLSWAGVAEVTEMVIDVLLVLAEEDVLALLVVVVVLVDWLPPPEPRL